MSTQQQAPCDNISTPVCEKTQEVVEKEQPNDEKGKKKNGLLRIIKFALNAAALVTLIVGMFFLILKGYITSRDTGVFDTAIKMAFRGNSFALIIVASTILTFAATVVQLYFDIGEANNFKIPLIANLTTVPFNLVAAILSIEALSANRMKTGLLLFAILAFVSLIFTVIRLAFIVVCIATKNEIYKPQGKNKRMLALILSSVLFVSVVGFAVVKEAVVKDQFVFDIGYNNTDNEYYAIVRAYCGTKENIVIPKKYKGYKVAVIKENAFAENKNMKSIVIPEGVTVIGSEAFYGCKNLTSITIPDSVISIGYRAFSNCEGFKSVVVPDSVTYIGSGAFGGCCNLESVVIPNSVTEMDSWVFDGCTNIKEATAPTSAIYYLPKDNLEKVIINGGEEIGYQAFKDCTKLTSITIPDSVTSIGEGAFYGCTALTNVVIPNSVIEIEYNAFHGCTSLTSVTIPDSVTSIGDCAFYGCTSLASVTIGDGVTTMGDCAFYGCTSLESVNISDLTSWCSIWFDYGEGTNPLAYAKKLCVNGEIVTELVIPNTVTSINSYAFEGYKFITSVIIPDSVTYIGYGAFEDCTALKSVTIPDSVTTIEGSAFSGCTSLESIFIPNSVTSIEWAAFGGCDSFTIYCEAEELPDSWNWGWNYNSECPVEWGHTHSYTSGKCVCGKSEN